jgi:hypothetical protein
MHSADINAVVEKEVVVTSPSVTEGLLFKKKQKQTNKTL